MQKRSLRLLPALILCIGFGLLFVYIATTISNKSIAHFDTSIIRFVQGMETPWLTSIMKFFTTLGNTKSVIGIALIAFVLLYFAFRYRQQAFLFIIIIGGTVVLNALLKNYFKRERPEIHRIMNANGFSFPSGHSMIAFSLYTIIVYIAWRNVKTGLSRTLLILFAAFMILMTGISRIYVGVHYPSDVVGGFAASGLWVTFAIIVYGAYQNPREKNKRPHS
jgi:undecaprenyl-diphosphatase